MNSMRQKSRIGRCIASLGEQFIENSNSIPMFILNLVFQPRYHKSLGLPTGTGHGNLLSATKLHVLTE